MHTRPRRTPPLALALALAALLLGFGGGQRARTGGMAPAAAAVPVTALRTRPALEPALWIPAGSSATMPRRDPRPILWTPARGGRAPRADALHPRPWRPGVEVATAR
jgi:hypothetical protein